MQGGLVMFPMDPKLKTMEEQIKAWEKEGPTKLDWYPNNEVDTYAPCDRLGTFNDPALRDLFGQDNPTDNMSDGM